MSNNSLQKLNNYFDRYIDGMFIKDIELLKERNDELRFSYPYILLTCSCIDLFGGIEKGFGESSGLRITWFVTEWMSKVNPLYRRYDLAYLIYDSWRCGVVHQATLKKGFETSSYIYPRDKHLHYIEDKERVFVHSLQFADDFIEAQKMYREYINESAANTFYIDSLYKHFLSMIGENKGKKNECFAQFIKYLRSNNLFFRSTDNGSATKAVSRTNTVVSSESSNQNMITRLPDETVPPAVPSAAPEENDIT